MQETKWYVLYTASRAEKVVEKRLIGEGVEVFLPTYIAKRKWSDRVKEVELPLFYSYIFVHCKEIKLRTLVLIPGVVSIVYYVGRPAVVLDSEIEAIKEFVKITEGNKVITEGDVVKIIGGPLEKVSGVVTKYGDRISYLYIKQLGATVCLETSYIEKVLSNQ